MDEHRRLKALIGELTEISETLCGLQLQAAQGKKRRTRRADCHCVLCCSGVYPKDRALELDSTRQSSNIIAVRGG